MRPNKPFLYYVDLISRILTQWWKVEWCMNISSCPPWLVSYWFQTMEAEEGNKEEVAPHSIPEYCYPLTAFTGQRDSWELSIKHLEPGIISLQKAYYPSNIFQKDQSLHTQKYFKISFKYPNCWQAIWMAQCPLVFKRSSWPHISQRARKEESCYTRMDGVRDWSVPGWSRGRHSLYFSK